MKVKIKVVSAVPAGNLSFYGRTPVIDGIKKARLPQIDTVYTMTLMESLTNLFTRRKK